MIVRMSKIEIVGPKECLLEVLALLRETGLFQFEAGQQGPATGERGLHTLILNEKTLTERIFYEHLHRTIDDLLACLPEHPGRESFLEPLGVIDAIAALAEKHLAHCSEISRGKEALHRERAELERLAAFLDTLDRLAAGIGAKSSLEFIGVALREEGGLERVVRLLADLTGGRFEIATDRAADGTIVALIAVAPDGSVYVSDTWNHRVQKFTADGRFLLQWDGSALPGDRSEKLWGPRGIVAGPDGRVYLTDTGNKRILVFDTSGRFLLQFDTEGDGHLDEPVGIALFFHNFSTFLGRPGIYLEDLFVRPAFRGKGIGKALLQHLAARALQEGWTRFVWQVLDWNTPAIEFYEAHGAKVMRPWLTCRVEGGGGDTEVGKQLVVEEH